MHPLPRDEYFAGLIDGEGYIGIVYQKPKKNSPYGHFYAALTVRMCAENIIQLLHARWPGYLSKRDPMKPQHNVAYCWTLHGRSAVAALTDLLPHVVLKRRQIELCLALESRKTYKGGGHDRDPEKKQPELDARFALFLECRRLNSHGGRRANQIDRLRPMAKPLLCRNGHPQNDETSYRLPSDNFRRRCKICTAEQNKNGHTKRRARKIAGAAQP